MLFSGYNLLVENINVKVRKSLFKTELEFVGTEINPDISSDLPDEFEDDEEISRGESTQQSRGKSKSHTPVLDNFGREISKLAEEDKLDPIIGRDIEIERVSQILSRRKKNNPILIGEPGVGKTAVVEGLALRIYQRKVSRTLFIFHHKFQFSFVKDEQYLGQNNHEELNSNFFTH